MRIRPKPMSDPAAPSSPPQRGRIATPATAAGQRGWLRWLPGIQTLRQYEVAWLRHDLVAGLVLTTMLVPVGIAYAVASGVPGIYGLYATIVPLQAYAPFGPGRILVLGPDSSLAAVILAVVLPLSGGDPMRAVALAGAMAVVSGLVCVVAGLVRLGFITELLSKPIRYGYMNVIALTVLVSQLPKLFGFSIESVGPLKDLWSIATSILDGRTNWTALAVGAGTLAVILLLKGSKRIPGILIAVVGATIVVGALDLGERADVKILGSLPQGLDAALKETRHLDGSGGRTSGPGSGQEAISLDELDTRRAVRAQYYESLTEDKARARGLGEVVPQSPSVPLFDRQY